MKKLLAVVTAAVLTMATAMTAYAAPVASGGDVSKEDPDDDGLTPEEKSSSKRLQLTKYLLWGKTALLLSPSPWITTKWMKMW